MKRVLLISYYWPPSGGAGVQRVLKTVKYLRDFGWEPIVYTAENADYPIRDESLLSDVPEDQTVIRHKIWEPYGWYKRFTGKGKKGQVYSGFLSENKKPSLTERLSIWIRGNFFIPDARRFWIKPSVKFLCEYLAENPVDAIMSSGPPHSVHLIARGVQQATGLPWVADFRDPWTNIDFYDQLRLTRWADRKHHRLEQEVVQHCDQLTTVSWTWAEEFRELGAEQVRVITNGFDAADFEEEQPPLTEQFVCSHIGYLNRDRNSGLLWQAFGELCQEIPSLKDDLRLRFVGKTDYLAFQQLAEQGLDDLVEKIPYVPHSEVLRYTLSSQLLLLLVNNVPNVMGHIPGKTYEYVASRRPILAIGPEAADFARVIRETKSGVVCGFEEKEKMKREIFKAYRRFKKGTLHNEEANISAFTRRHAAGQFGEVLDKVIMG